MTRIRRLGPAPIIDFDGTLASLPVPWDQIRAELGIARITDLWDADRPDAWSRVRDAEIEAAQRALLIDVVADELVDTNAFAVLTSNSETAVWTILDRAPRLHERAALVVGRESLSGPKSDQGVFRRGYERCVQATAAARAGTGVVYVGNEDYEIGFARDLGATAIHVAELHPRVMTNPIPISAVRIGAEEEALVTAVLRSGHLAQGPMVARLEQAFTEMCGVRHAVAVSSGTTALVAALQALGVGPGDEVVTSPFTFAATLNAILEAGATARFADIDPMTFTLAPAAIDAVVTDRTRVILPVHLYGQPAPMREIEAYARSRGVAVVEDAAQAHGATCDETPVGSFGIACFSLYATKNVTTGEGGVVTTDDDEVADRLRLLRNQGMARRYEYVIPGHNYRMTDLQAALGIPQMARLDDTTRTRQENARVLSAGLNEMRGISIPAVAPGRTHVFHQYTVRVGADAPIDRDLLATRLEQQGIGVGIYYPRVVFDYACYRDHPGVVVASVPEARRAAQEVLSLPVHQHCAEGDLDRILQAVRRSLDG